MEKYFVTFGSAHIHSVNGKTFDKDCICVIEAESYSEGREIAFAAFGPVYAFFYEEQDWKAESTALFPRGFIDLEYGEPAVELDDALMADLTVQTMEKLDKLNQEQSALWEFSTNGEVLRLVNAARARLKECFGESCEVHSQSVSRRYCEPMRFYALLYVAVPYEVHLRHCDDGSFVSPENLSTTWDMEDQDIVLVGISSALPDEALATLVDLGKLKTVVSPASTYQTVSCDL